MGNIDFEKGNESVVYKELRPTSTPSLINTKQWRFSLQVAENEHVNFFENSLYALIYTTWLENNVRKPTDATLIKPGICLEPCIGGRPFIKDVEVYFDNTLISTSRLNNTGFLYSKFSQLYNADIKDESEFFMTANDTVFKTVENLSKKILKSCEYFKYKSTDPVKHQLLNIPLHGINIFETTNKSIKSMSNINLNYIYIPPNTKVDIIVYLFDDPENIVWRENISIDQYFSTTPLTNLVYKGLKIEFKDAYLIYRSTILKPQKRLLYEKMLKDGGKLEYPFHIPIAVNSLINAGITHTSTAFNIFGNVELCYLFFVPTHGLYTSGSAQRPMAAFARFPQNNIYINAYYNNVDNILWKGGLKNVGIAQNNSDISMKQYYLYLIENKLFSSDFNKLFNTDSVDQSLIHMIPLDCRNHSSNNPATIHVELNFNEKFSPEGYEIVLISICTSGKLTYSRKTGWNVITPF